MFRSMFSKVLLLLLIVGGLNWGVYGIWGLNAIGWLLGGSLGWLARTIFSVVGVASLSRIAAIVYWESETRRPAPDPHVP